MGEVITRMAVDEEFYLQTSTTPKFNIGVEITVAKGLEIPTVYKYVKAAAALTAYQPYILVHDKDGVTTASPATSTVPVIVGVPQVAIAKDAYGFVAIGGLCKAKTGIQAAGDTLEVINSGTTLIVDGSSGTPAETVNTVAISCETAAAAATVKVQLLNKRVQLAAS